MKEVRPPSVEETLTRLGIEEIAERLEVSPLFMGGGAEAQGGTEDTEFCCCSCKMPWPDDPPEPVEEPSPFPPADPVGG